MAIIGMEPEQIESVAADLRRQAGELTAIRTRVNSQVQHATENWRGPDLQQFTDLWYGSYQSQLASACTILSAMADALVRQAADQRATSSGDGISAPGGIGAGTSGGPILQDPSGGATPINLDKWALPSKLPADYKDTRAKVSDALRAQLAKSGLTDKQQRQAIDYIAYLLATAPEPYKTLYLHDLTKLHYEQIPGGGYYIATGKTDTVHVNFKDAYSDPRGPFFVLFHEMGHGVDDLSDDTTVQRHFLWFHWTADVPNSSYYSPSYTNGGTALSQALNTDVRDNISQTISTNSFATDSAQQARVVDAIMNGSVASLSQADRAVANQVQQYYQNSDMATPQGNVASDIYGSATHGFIQPLYGHSADYWAQDPKYPTLEFWAGYAADKIVGGNNLQITKDFLPSGAKLADQMAQQMDR